MNEEYKNAIFEGGMTHVDGRRFVACVFNKTVLVYSGGAAPAFDRCTFNGTTWNFEGPAGNTINFLHGLHKSPFRPIVQKIIKFLAGEGSVPREMK